MSYSAGMTDLLMWAYARRRTEPDELMHASRDQLDALRDHVERHAADGRCKDDMLIALDELKSRLCPPVHGLREAAMEAP